ncbi:MAG TPA: 3-hydroxyacyl-CoA dehydrogenase NAD-binding domain-containing protein [Aquimonas sp.]|nr:3-hydroxyacyl-CoA dehydrogenase NAD-binding domain-containing protein [Aquimonas sp.]HRF53481.1 3-hydroxyacyl-CoA dehydrogenase NAD-binding domain-containing protein [Aquimonas sp.]
MFDGLRFAHWHTEVRADGIVVLTLDRLGQSVNALAQAVLGELEQIVERIAIEKPKGVLIRSAKSAGFIAGADIAEFKTFDERGTVFESIRFGQNVLQKLAELPCPTVAAIHGHCMGGGTELALACRYRVATTDDSTRIALPEVKLGIYPGWGGSVRLPDLVGAPAAFDMMLTGRGLSAAAARGIGLVDKTCEPALLLDTALQVLQRGINRPLKQRATAWLSTTWLARQALSPMLVKQVARKARKAHYPAPFALIETWRRNGGSVESRLLAEAKSVAKLAQTPTARNLVRVFFLQERLKNLGSKDGQGTPLPNLQRVHVIGAGVMGGDIAAWCALRGFETSLQDQSLAQVQPAIERAHTFYGKKIRQEAKRAAAMARLKADVDGQEVARADLVIEAIYENSEAKRALYAKVEESLPQGSLLSSNTSSIPLTDLRAELKRPAQFAGLHFFNPVAMMPLVEIVRHDGMDANTERRLAAFCRAIDKLPVPVAGSPGFLVNRILMPYLLEAMTCYSEGIPGPVIDKAALAFGMPMGPIELADTVGLDVAASVGKLLAEFLGLPIPSGLDGLLATGKRGRKDGQGFYTWVDGRAQKPEVPKDYHAPDDLTDRLILPFLNEAVACLHEGVVADEDLLDAGVIFGTGFAPFRGGPITHIRTEGAAKLKARLQQLADRHGPRFAPRPGWDALI